MKHCTKNISNRMLSVVLLVLMVGFVSAMTFVGEDERGYMIFSSDKQVVKINPSKNSMLINNLVDIHPFPSMRVMNTEISMPEPRFDKPVVGAEQGTFTVTYPEAFSSDVYATVNIQIVDKDITQEIKLENTKDIDAIVELKLTDDKNIYSVYAPYARDSSNQMVFISPTERGLYGNMLIIYFEPYPPSYPLSDVNVTISPKKMLIWAIKIPSKSTYTLRFHYLGAYFGDSTILNAFPVKSVVDKEVFLLSERDPLFNEENKYLSTNFMPSINLTSGSTGIYTSIVNYVNSLPSGDPDFPLKTQIDWGGLLNKSGYNSLEKSLIFREAARRVGIPSRIVLGKKRSGNYYAWVEAYIGGLTRTYDPFNLRSDYNQIYSEPETYFCKDEIGSCAFESAVKTGVICVGVFCVNVIWLIAIVVVLTLAGFVTVTYKSNIIARLLAEKPTKELIIDGTYTITRPDFSSDNPLLMDIFNYLKNKKGIMNVDTAVAVLGYSKVLIKGGMEKLIETGVIKRS